MQVLKPLPMHVEVMYSPGLSQSYATAGGKTIMIEETPLSSSNIPARGVWKG